MADERYSMKEEKVKEGYLHCYSAYAVKCFRYNTTDVKNNLHTLLSS